MVNYTMINYTFMNHTMTNYRLINYTVINNTMIDYAMTFYTSINNTIIDYTMTMTNYTMIDYTMTNYTIKLCGVFLHWLRIRKYTEMTLLRGSRRLYSCKVRHAYMLLLRPACFFYVVLKKSFCMLFYHKTA